MTSAESEGDLIFMTDRDPLLKGGAEFGPEDTLGSLERHPLTLVGGRIHVNDKYAL